MTSTQAGQRPLDVVIVSAFDRVHRENNATFLINLVYRFVHQKLTQSANNRLGFVRYAYNNKYDFDMRTIHQNERSTVQIYYSPDHKMTDCPPYNMACGLSKAHELIMQRQGSNGIILLFLNTDIPGSYFFHGASQFISSVPVHTFGIHWNTPFAGVLQAMADNSPGGKYHRSEDINTMYQPIDITPPFKYLLESILLSSATSMPAAAAGSVQMVGPWGGNGGTAYEIQQPDQLQRLESVTVYPSPTNGVGSIQFSYIDQGGQKQSFGPWGMSNAGTGQSTGLQLQIGPTKIVKEIYGTTGDNGSGNIVVTSLTIVTDGGRTYGPLGKIAWGNTHFHEAAPDNHSIVGFYGRADGQFVYQIGVYVRSN